MNGYILESKSIIGSEIWKKPPLYFKVWHYLLLKAQFKQNGNLDRGQLFTSIPEIADACSYYVGFRKVTPSKKEIWSVLQFLRNPNEGNDEGNGKGTMIETTKVTHGIIVTICNYNKYQDPTTYESNTEGNDENPAKELRKGRDGNNIKNELIMNKNEKNISNNTITYQKIVELYHECCPSLSKVRSLSDTRKKHIKARLQKHTIDEFREVFEKTEASDWCTGRSSDWKADLDWIVKSEDHFLRVLEGRYDNKDKTIDKARDSISRIQQGMTQEEIDEQRRLFG